MQSQIDRLGHAADMRLDAAINLTWDRCEVAIPKAGLPEEFLREFQAIRAKNGAGLTHLIGVSFSWLLAHQFGQIPFVEVVKFFRYVAEYGADWVAEHGGDLWTSQ